MDRGRYACQIQPAGVTTAGFCEQAESLELQLYTATVTSLALCGCGTWLLALREEHRLRGL